MVLKELIYNSFLFGRVWWYLERTAFLTVSTLGGCGGLERTDFDQFPLWMGMVVFNELIFHSFLLSEGVVIIERTAFLTVSTVGRMWSS